MQRHQRLERLYVKPSALREPKLHQLHQQENQCNVASDTFKTRSELTLRCSSRFLLKQRASEFAGEYVHWFTKESAAVHGVENRDKVAGRVSELDRYAGIVPAASRPAPFLYVAARELPSGFRGARGLPGCVGSGA